MPVNFPTSPRAPTNPPPTLKLKRLKVCPEAAPIPSPQKASRNSIPLRNLDLLFQNDCALLDYPNSFDACELAEGQNSSRPGVHLWGGRRSFLKNTGQ